MISARPLYNRLERKRALAYADSRSIAVCEVSDDPKP